MPRPSEIAYFSERIASLIVAAARTGDPGLLSEIRSELMETIDGALALVAHDAGALTLDEALLQAASTRAATEAALQEERV